MSHWVAESFGVDRPLVGMLHAPPLPGASGYRGSWPEIETSVLRDAEVLVQGGMHGLLLENYGDAPFSPGRVAAPVATCLTTLAAAVRRRFNVPLGINVLRNDAQTALAVALAAGAAFIRVNILCGVRVTDQGLIQGQAYRLLRLRSYLAATAIRILADVNVKHSAPLAARCLADEVEDLLSRGRADGLIVSGAATGKPAELSELEQVRQAAAGRCPVWLGSGVNPTNLAAFLPCAEGLIVGTSIKAGGRAENPVDPARVRALVEQWTAFKDRPAKAAP